MRISDWSSDVCSSDLRIQNAATATVKGVEAEFQAAASDNLTLRGAVSLLDTEYKSFNPAPAVGPNGTFSIIDASGNRLVAAPKMTGNLGIEYRTQIAANAVTASDRKSTRLNSSH